MPDDYVPQADAPTGGNPVVFRPETYARHSRAVKMVEGENRALYPRSPRGRTTRSSRGAWGFLASGHTISGASGLSLGSGTVQLCSRSGGSLTADGDNVSVLNSGSAITGPKSLPLEWTDGAFAVCVCGETVTCLPCAPCQIPKKDLTVSWVNTLSGTGSTPLVFNGTGGWSSACANQLLYGLSCAGGVLQFAVTYFLTGDCPVGQRQSCISPGSNPFNLVLIDHTCNPFHLHYRCTVASCVVLGDDGYTDFYIDDPGSGDTVTRCPECNCVNCNVCGTDGAALDHASFRITDSNGTHALTLLSGPGLALSACSAEDIMSAPVPVQTGLTEDDPPWCIVGSAPVPYRYCVTCEGESGQIHVFWYSPGANFCNTSADTAECVYAGTSVADAYVVPTCTETTLTAVIDNFTALHDDLTFCSTDHPVLPELIGVITLEIDLIPPTKFCQTIGVFACPGGSAPVSGVTVNIHDHEGGTLLHTCVTNSSGICPEFFFDDTGSPFWVTATEPSGRFADYAASRTMSCNKLVGITTNIFLEPASGYHCFANCALPVSDTLHATHPKYGALTFTYNGAGSHGAGWYAAATYSYIGCRCCPSKTVTIVCYIDSTGNYMEYWSST